MNHDVQLIYERFRNPDNTWRPMPFWFLNHKLSEPELRRQLSEMNRQGIGGVVLHARHGLRTPFMSDEWLDMIGVCVDECSARAMEVWLYDEDNWPSGTFGGKLTKEHPEFRMRYLRVEDHQAPNGAEVQLTLHEGNTFLAAFGVCSGGLSPGESVVADITAHVKDNRVCWQAPDERWRLAVFWECEVGAGVTFANGYYLDTMNPEAARAFVDLAYEPYWRRFHAEFGRTIRGVFTDEPGLMIHDGFFGSRPIRTRVDDLDGTLPGVVLPWTRDCLTRFAELKGYDLRPSLPPLLYEVGGDWAQVRLDFYEALTTWYVEAYHGTINRWCNARGVEYIGHTLEEPLWGQVRSQGNQIRVLEQFHRPGLDYLGSGIGSRDRPHRILSVKCASSVAHVQGKPRVLCEAFGGSGHGHSLAARKLDASFMAVLGVNMYIPHAFYYSFDGYRKTDWPPTEFYHAPHWPYYRTFADYLARLSLIQSSGYHVADLAILSPIRSAQLHIFHSGHCERELAEDAIYAYLSDRLLRLHHDYDYVDDSQLSRAEVNGGRLAFPTSPESYRTILLPLCRVLSLAAAERLQSFFADGGRLIAMGCVPDLADQRGDHAAVRAAMAGVFGEYPVPGIHRTSPGGGIAVFLPTWDGKACELSTLLRNLDPPDIRCIGTDGREAEDVYVCHRVVGDAHFLMVVNTLGDPRNVTLCLNQTGPVMEWDLERGDVVSCAEGCTDVGSQSGMGGGHTSVELKLLPWDCRLLGIGAEVPMASATSRCSRRETGTQSLTFTPNWQFSTREPNVLILDCWQSRLRDQAAARLEHQGSVGQTNTYATQFTVFDLPRAAWLVFDNLKQWIPPHMGFLGRFRSLEIYLNNRRLPALAASNWQDPYYLEAEVTDLLVVGTNLLEIRTISGLEPMHCLTDPVYLIGEFTLVHGGLAVPQPHVAHYWTLAGYPNYSGIGIYRQEIEVPADYATSEWVELSLADVRDGCAVYMNERLAGVRPWAPFSVEVTGLLVPGANQLRIEVWNSLANLYGKEARLSGLAGPFTLHR